MGDFRDADGGNGPRCLGGLLSSLSFGGRHVRAPSVRLDPLSCSTFQAAGANILLRDCVFVHIQADVDDTLLHDPSPMHELGAGRPSATLVNLHIVRRVALSQANIWSR
jgi:hypothetical protein